MSTFVFLGLMWSFWSSDSSEWVSVMKQAGTSGAGEWLLLLGGLAGLYVVLVVLDVLEAKGWSPFFEERGMSFTTVASRTGLMALVLVGVGMPQVYERAGEDAASVIASLQGSRLNARDQAQLERGYYENLMSNDSYTSGLFGAQTQQEQEGWEEIYETDAVDLREDIRLWSLRPSVHMQFKHANLSTNQWGMRDQDYTREKPEGAYRMALLGASYVMGAGVADGETFETLVEDRLNARTGADSAATYEILNFSVGGYGLGQQVAVLENEVFAFAPDAVLYVVQPEEVRRTIERLLPAVLDGKQIDVPYIRQILDELGVTSQMDRPEARRLLFTRGEEMVEKGYARIAELSREHGAVPVLVCLPNTRRPFEDNEIVFLRGLADRLGLRFVDLRTAYDGHDVEGLVVAPWDAHPNREGHRLIADVLYDQLLAQPDLQAGAPMQTSAGQ
ncbi:MAG: SGNH/GDSL hydrolase family protein [Rhodothermales bacterium]